MLRAYEYCEENYLELDLLSPDLFTKHLQLAEDFVKDNPPSIKGRKCPVCNSVRRREFFKKWNVTYYQCEDCSSVFADCGNSEVARYLSNSLRQNLISCEDYQSIAERQRTDTWVDFIDWIKFRSYRYLGLATGLSIIDIENPFSTFSRIIAESDLCGEYRHLQVADLARPQTTGDIVLYLNQLQKSLDPIDDLRSVGKLLSPKGILVISTRAGSGFDVLALKGGNDRVFPYEHVLLPSKEGLALCLREAGYDLIEMMTPGVMDINYVAKNIHNLDSNQSFIKYLITKSDDATLQEFQRFLQKGLLSSHIQAIARKR